MMVRQNNEWKSQLDKERSAVLSLLEDGSGNIWAATSRDGLYVLGDFSIKLPARQ
ncbi:MAG: hypothetical protein ACOYOU_20235 [Kiritimatiellia bacterium]